MGGNGPPSAKISPAKSCGKNKFGKTDINQVIKGIQESGVIFKVGVAAQKFLIKQTT